MMGEMAYCGARIVAIGTRRLKLRKRAIGEYTHINVIGHIGEQEESDFCFVGLVETSTLSVMRKQEKSSFVFIA